MEKFIVLYGAGGYDGDDNYCFGNANLVGIAETRKDAIRLAKEEAEKIADEFFPVMPDPEEYNVTDDLEEYTKERNKTLDCEEELDSDGNLETIKIYHNDDMFPHFGIVRIIKTEV